MLKDERLLSGGKDKTIRIWQVGEKELILKEQLQGHNHVVYGVSELDDGRLASCGGDNSIIIWKSGAMHEY
jgi:WD40 repeat protein